MNEMEEFLSSKIEDHEPTVRVRNCMRNAGIVYVWQLLDETHYNLLRFIPNFGCKCLEEINHLYVKNGLNLRNYFSDWWPDLHLPRGIEEIKINLQIKHLENRLKELRNE